MAHVREELGLVAVELGEQFQSLPFGPVALGTGDRRGVLRGHEREEIAIGGVEPLSRARSEHQRERRGPAGCEADDERLGRPFGPCAGGQGAASLVDVGHDERRKPTTDLIDGIGPRGDGGGSIVQVDLDRSGRIALVDPDRRQQARRRRVLVQLVEQREGHIGVVRCRHLGEAAYAHLDVVDRNGGQRLQRADAPLGEHVFRRLAAHDQRAAHDSRLGVDRAVAVGEVDLLEVATAVEGHELVLEPGVLALAHDGIDLRTDDVPDLLPALVGPLTECRGVQTLAEARPVGVVVQAGGIATPEQEHRIPGVEHDAHRGPQALRPVRDRIQRGRRPVERRDPFGHLAVGREHADERRRTRRCPLLTARAAHRRHRRFPLVPGRGERALWATVAGTSRPTSATVPQRSVISPGRTRLRTQNHPNG